MKKVGQYKLLTRLGAGCDGDVWVAIDKDNNLVALKCFHSGSNSLAQGEYDCACQFEHPHLLHPLAFIADEEGAPLMVMPYCVGRSLDNLSGYFPEEKAWELLCEISSALEYLHEEGWCHGDVKPSNVLWNNRAFLLADFGACHRFLEKPAREDVSSFKFLAPEKSRTDKSDIWSMGATVFNLIMGSSVFGGLGGSAQRENSPVPYMRRSMPALSELVCRCLSYHPESRPTASEIRIIAQKALSDYRTRKKKRPVRNRVEVVSEDSYGAFWPEVMKNVQV